MVLAARLLTELTPHSGVGADWEKLVAGLEESGFMQSLHWAKVKERQGLLPLHLGLFDGNCLVGGCMFYTTRDHKGAGLLVAPEGPVLPWNDQHLAREGLGLMLRYAESHASELDVIAVRIEPRLRLPVPKVLNEFGRAPVDLIPRETVYLDLTRELDQVLADMKPKGRYNTRLAGRHEIVVREGSPQDVLSHFYPVLQESGQRNDFAVEPLSFFIELASTLIPAGLLQLFIAEHENETLGTLMLVKFGTRATYLYGGITNEKRNLMAGYALQWAAIGAAKQSGCTTYDMYGFDQFGAPGNRYSRFSRFKSLFNGQVIRFIGAHDYFLLDSLANTVIRAFNELA